MQKPNKNLKELLMFDIGGVILDYDENIHYAKVAHNIGVKPTLLVPFVSNLVIRMEAGTLTIKEVEHIIAEKFGAKASQVRWEMEFINSSRPNVKVIKLANMLHKTCRVVLASNTNIGDYRTMLGKNGTLKELKYDKAFGSCYMGIRKPNPKFYRHILKFMKCNASNAIFIDNKKENVIAARKLGILSIQFRNADSLVDDLRKLLNDELN